MTITEFLLARIAEDEAVATRALVDDGRQVWQVQDWIELEAEVLAHTERHHPHRVLAEAAAKRQIVEEHAIGKGDSSEGCYRCNWVDDWGWNQEGPCDTLRILASIFRDHPDYDTNWRPERVDR